MASVGGIRVFLPPPLLSPTWRLPLHTTTAVGEIDFSQWGVATSFFFRAGHSGGQPLACKKASFSSSFYSFVCQYGCYVLGTGVQYPLLYGPEHGPADGPEHGPEDGPEDGPADGPAAGGPEGGPLLQEAAGAAARFAENLPGLSGLSLG